MLQIQCTRPFSDEDNDDDKVDMTEYKDNNQNQKSYIKTTQEKVSSL